MLFCLQLAMLFCPLLAMHFFSFFSPSAARGYLLLPLSFSRLHTLCVGSLVLCPQSFSLSTLAGCGRDAVVLESVCLFSRARHWRRNPAGTTHVVRPCFQGLRADVCTLSLVVVLCGPSSPSRSSWFMTSISNRLFRIACARLRLVTPAAVAASADQVPRGQLGTTRRIPHFAD